MTLETTDSVNDEVQDAWPSITFLNASGDITVEWDDSNKEAVFALIEKKMKERYTFFIIRSGVSGRRPKLKSMKDLKQATGVRVSQIVDGKMIGDEELADAFTAGLITFSPTKQASTELSPIKAETPAEVMTSQTIAVRPIHGG